MVISRSNTNNSRLVKENNISELFEKNGFKIVRLEDCSYEEQIDLFSNSSVIVGSSGAALTNIVYCKPGTTIVCIVPEQYHFYMYSTIAHLNNLKCLFISPEIVEKTKYMSMDKWKLDEKSCLKLIEYISRQ